MMREANIPWTHARFEQAEQLFQAAADLPPDDRGPFLERQCAGDENLRAFVEGLLSHYDTGMGDFLQQPLVPSDPDEDGDPEPTMPSRIGRYTILRELGRGGMGVVYEAKQDHPQRAVALKVIRPDFALGSQRRRFQLEAEVLGQLQHPAIACIHDAGIADVQTATGHVIRQPFFAMELIRGQPLNDYAADKNLDPAARLELLVKVCDGVQHAHQRGVIHRDLKPANILVDCTGQPKILDFGVARVTDGDLKVSTLQTGIGQLIGTIAYMSPEQVTGDSRKIEVRSDVYALGVVGYELLAGRRPLDSAHQSIPHALHTISEEDPVPLSRVDRMFRGDLDVIFARALEKSPDRRYPSVRDLAADIRRHLDDRPIVARPASAFYQIRKFAKRNKTLVGGTIATMIALAVGLIATTFAMVQAAAQRDAAEVSAARAKMEAAKAEAVNAFLQDMFASVTPASARGTEISVRDVLNEAARRIKDGALHNQPEVQAAVHITIGNTYGALGAYPEAETHLRAGLEIQRARNGNRNLELARTCDALASLLQAAGNYAEAEPLYREALAIRRQRHGAKHPEVAESIHNLASLAHHQGHYDRAEKLYREALTIRRKVLGAEHSDVAMSLFDLAALLHHKGDYTAAEVLWREALSMNRRLLGDDHPQVSRTLTGLARTLRAKGNYDEAEPLYREALAIGRKVYGQEHPAVALILNNLAVLLRMKGDYARAEPLHREALAMGRKLLGAEHPTVTYTLHDLAVLLDAQGERAKAEPLFREALAIRRKVLGADHPAVADSLSGLARLLQAKGNCTEAEPLYREALLIRRKKLPRRHRKIAETASALGDVLIGKGKFEEAEPLLLNGYADLKDDPQVQEASKRAALRRIVRLYEAWGKPDKIVPYRTMIAALDVAASTRPP